MSDSSLASIQERITIVAEAAFSLSSSSDSVEHVRIGKENADCRLRRMHSCKNMPLSITAMNPLTFWVGVLLTLSGEPAHLQKLPLCPCASMVGMQLPTLRSATTAGSPAGEDRDCQITDAPRFAGTAARLLGGFCVSGGIAGDIVHIAVK